MKKIVIIGANEFQNPLILKAKEMGYETHVFAWKCGAIGEKTADYFYPISIIEKDAILEECRRIQPDAITTIGSDLGMITVNYLTTALGLPGNSAHCCLISTNKYEMRRAFMKAGVATPRFTDVSCAEEIPEEFTYPLIVKPTDRSGSRAITKVMNKEGLPEAICSAIENSFEKKAIVEEYIEGDEYSCECISYHGKHHLLAFTKKYTTGAPHFIETGHMQPSDIPVMHQEHIRRQVFGALDALEITEGASHTEFKLQNNGEIRIIEIGARMGGDCIGSHLVKISTGYDFVRMVVDIAAGKEPDMILVCKPRDAYIHFLFQKEDVEIYDRLKKEHPEWIYEASECREEMTHQVIDSSSRYGYYILALDKMEDYWKWLKREK